MPIIRHGDREIHYEPYEWNEDVKIFHQDYSPISASIDYAINADWGGQAELDLESLGKNHNKSFYATKPFNETPPESMPSYDYFIYEEREKKFPYMDLLNVAGLPPNQLVVSYKLMGLFQKYRMAPYVTAPVVVKHRDQYIDDYYVMLYFWHHGCDQVVWEKSVFAMIEPIEETYLSFFTINSFDEYKEFRKKVAQGGIYYRPVSIVFDDKYDIFYSDILNILISQKIKEQILKSNYKNVKISKGSYFETLLI